MKLAKVTETLICNNCRNTWGAIDKSVPQVFCTVKQQFVFRQALFCSRFKSNCVYRPHSERVRIIDNGSLMCTQTPKEGEM